MKGKIIKFGRHNPPDDGHITVKFRCGYPSKYRQVRYKVKQINNRWICDNGEDVTESVEAIERLKQIKKLENHLGS